MVRAKSGTNAINTYIFQKYNFILKSYNVCYISKYPCLSKVKMMFNLVWLLPSAEPEIKS